MNHRMLCKWKIRLINNMVCLLYLSNLVDSQVNLQSANQQNFSGRMIKFTKIEFTAEYPVWDPTSSEFAEKDDASMNYRGEVITREATASGKFVINLVGTCADAAAIKDDESFGLTLENEVAVSRVGVSNSTAKPKIDYLTLRKKWSIFPYI